MTADTRPFAWDSPGLPPRDRDERCQWHHRLCAYRHDDPVRCPWCHRLWSLLRTSTDHSCEQPKMWDKGDRAWRVRTAREMRLEATQAGGRSPDDGIRASRLRKPALTPESLS